MNKFIELHPTRESMFHQRKEFISSISFNLRRDSDNIDKKVYCVDINLNYCNTDGEEIYYEEEYKIKKEALERYNLLLEELNL